jgi:hypothetical protein
LRLSMEPLEEPLEQLNVLIQQKKWHSQVKILPHGTRTVFDPENKVISI